MSDGSKIEWTDATWNPITGCTLVSEGCRHCYAAQLAATRLKHLPSRAGLARINAAGEAKFTGEVRFNRGWLDQPLHWTRPRMIFVCAHGDLFHENVPDAWVDQVFAVMALARQHTFQVLTKRPEEARDYLSAPDRQERVWIVGLSLIRELLNADRRAPLEGWRMPQWPLPNVWLGTSVEDQAAADTRIPHLLGAPAAVRFVSAEPLLGPIDLRQIDDGAAHREVPEEEWGPVDDDDSPPALWWDSLTGERTIMHGGADGEWSRFDPSLDWVIVGGESGSKARAMHPDWARSLRDQCAAAGVPFFFKQWGEHRPLTDAEHGQACGAVLGGEDPHDRDAYMLAVGKRNAGRVLDGVTHHGFPNATERGP